MTKEVKMVLGVVAVVVVFAGLGFFLLKQQNDNLPKVSTDQSEALTRSTPNVRGKADSTIKVIEFGDIQCPACAAVNPLMDELYKQYGDRVSFTFRHFPLPMHANAYAGSDAAEAAGEQGKFWDMVTKLYEVQPIWAETSDPSPTYEKLAQELGLNMDQFTKAYSSKAHRNRIDQDKADGQYLGVNGTPTFYVNGEQILQGGPAQVKNKIEELLKTQTITSDPVVAAMEMNAENAPMNSGKTEGAIFGYINKALSVTNSDQDSIVFDSANWFGGSEAEQAAKKDGVEIHNPFYIRNTDKTTTTYTLNKDAKIKLISMGNSDMGVGIKDGTFTDLQKVLAEYAETPFWIKTDGNSVVYIEQQYIP